jgi:hypothetical protein
MSANLRRIFSDREANRAAKDTTLTLRGARLVCRSRPRRKRRVPDRFHPFQKCPSQSGKFERFGDEIGHNAAAAILERTKELAASERLASDAGFITLEGDKQSLVWGGNLSTGEERECGLDGPSPSVPTDLDPDLDDSKEWDYGDDDDDEDEDEEWDDDCLSD